MDVTTDFLLRRNPLQNHMSTIVESELHSTYFLPLTHTDAISSYLIPASGAQSQSLVQQPITEGLAIFLESNAWWYGFRDANVEREVLLRIDRRHSEHACYKRTIGDIPYEASHSPRWTSRDLQGSGPRNQSTYSTAPHPVASPPSSVRCEPTVP